MEIKAKTPRKLLDILTILNLDFQAVSTARLAPTLKKFTQDYTFLILFTGSISSLSTYNALIQKLPRNVNCSVVRTENCTPHLQSLKRLQIVTIAQPQDIPIFVKRQVL
jgi:hypothetical protein